MRALWMLLVLSVMAVVLGAWTSTSESVSPPTCTAQDKALTYLVSRNGYYLSCRPGFALVRVRGATYRLRNSKCFDGARLHFGLGRFRSSAPPANGLYLVLDRPHGKAGADEVIDGSIEIVTGAGRILSGAISGKAQVQRGSVRGTFSVLGRTDTADGVRFTGSWRCG